jgi:hypothetical protein
MASLTQAINTNIRRYSIGLEKLYVPSPLTTTPLLCIKHVIEQVLLQRECGDDEGGAERLAAHAQAKNKGGTRPSRYARERSKRYGFWVTFTTTPHPPHPADANAMRVICARDTEAAAVKQRQCQELKATCKADLDTALPALNSAVEALKSLSKGDIGEIKAMKSPPRGVKLVMEAVCIMFDLKPDRVASDDGKSKVNDYWKPAQKLLADMRFLQNCFEYDKDNIGPEIVAAIAPFISSADFEPKVIEKVSRAANGLCKWVRAMYVTTFPHCIIVTLSLYYCNTLSGKLSHPLQPQRIPL